MIQIDGKTLEQIIEYFEKDEKGFKGLAFVPSYDLFPERVNDILNRMKDVGFKMPRRMPSVYNECLFINLMKKEIDVGAFDKFGIKIYSIVSTEVLEEVLNHFYKEK
ncbi:hypothetical protein IKQ02_02645 [bacterium]|nr:hypothetical protein [bacterium]